MTGIVTLASNLPPWGEITIPRIREYAQRIGAEFVLLKPPKYEGFFSRGPMFKEQALRFERTCFIDADCVVSREAPNIFDWHATGSVWMAPDSAPIDEHQHCRFQDMVLMQAVLGAIGWYRGYGNMGVLLCDAGHAAQDSIFDYWQEIPGVHNDQANVNYRIRKWGYTAGFMARAWNCMAISIGLPNTLDSVPYMADIAHIAHAAGFSHHPDGEKNRQAAIEKLNELMP